MIRSFGNQPASRNSIRIPNYFTTQKMYEFYIPVLTSAMDEFPFLSRQNLPLFFICSGPQLGWCILQIAPEVVFTNVPRRVAIQREEIIGALPETHEISNQETSINQVFFVWFCHWKKQPAPVLGDFSELTTIFDLWIHQLQSWSFPTFGMRQKSMRCSKQSMIRQLVLSPQWSHLL